MTLLPYATRFRSATETKGTRPAWGCAGSPLVIGGTVFVNVGAHGTALDKKTGKILWSTGREAASYSSIVPHVRDGRQELVMFAHKALVALDPKTGSVFWSYPWETKHDTNVADPILIGDKVFISSGYDRGCALLHVAGFQLSQLWVIQTMPIHFNPCLLIDTHAYGLYRHIRRTTPK